uniref:RNA-directed DNA polymerase n=1 Tax=Anopheles christyi TaxID=43041 RepID=A0A182KDN4_9DIPT
HPSPNAKLVLDVDASNQAIGAALNQLTDKGPEPLAFFSEKLTPHLCKASTYDGNCTRYMKLSDTSETYTDHKPLTTAFHQRRQIIGNMHEAAHPGVKATTHMVTQRFVWPTMRRDCKQYVSICNACQQTKLKPIDTSNHNPKYSSYIQPHVSSYTHVFVRVDSVRPSLTPPYDGPFRVVKKRKKTFVLEVRGRNV